MCAFCLCLLIVIHYWSIFNSTLHHSLWHTCQISEGGKPSGADRLYHSAVQWLQGSAPISDVISTIDLLRQKIFGFSPRVSARDTQVKGTPFLRRYKSARVHSARSLNATHRRAAENACYARGERETGAFPSKSVKWLNFKKYDSGFWNEHSPDGSSKKLCCGGNGAVTCQRDREEITGATENVIVFLLN